MTVIVCGSTVALIVRTTIFTKDAFQPVLITAFYTNYLPVPLVLLTGRDGSQSVHIAPEAFNVSSAEFPDQIDVWQNALPFDLKGNLKSVRNIPWW